MPCVVPPAGGGACAWGSVTYVNATGGVRSRAAGVICL